MKKEPWKILLQLHAEPGSAPAGGGDGSNGGGDPAAGNPGGGDLFMSCRRPSKVCSYGFSSLFSISSLSFMNISVTL